jgi:hypothetical protein
LLPVGEMIEVFPNGEVRIKKHVRVLGLKERNRDFKIATVGEFLWLIRRLQSRF